MRTKVLVAAVLGGAVVGGATLATETMASSPPTTPPCNHQYCLPGLSKCYSLADWTCTLDAGGCAGYSKCGVK